MLVIKNIDKISNYSSTNIVAIQTPLAYIFQIENKFGPTYQITLSRIHPPQANHPHRHYYCMTYEGQQMWVQRKDVMDCQKFLLTMTHFMANVI
jgi:hypothetical protein